jgi:hypothetical protein
MSFRANACRISPTCNAGGFQFTVIETPKGSSTLGDDGDPLDVLVLMDSPAAIHRIEFQGRDDRRLLGPASLIITLALVPLTASISLGIDDAPSSPRDRLRQTVCGNSGRRDERLMRAAPHWTR